MRATKTLQALIVSALFFAGCVHTRAERVGRMRLGDGREGTAKVFATRPAGYEEIAIISVEADNLGTAERLQRHLLRRASLMGCAGVTDLVVKAHLGAQAMCIGQREPTNNEKAPMVVVDPSQALLEAAKNSGAQGQILLRVLAQVRERPLDERAWPLQWYLNNYPQSPFASEVRALFVEGVSTPTAHAASVRMAPTSP